MRTTEADVCELPECGRKTPGPWSPTVAFITSPTPYFPTPLGGLLFFLDW